MTCVQVECMSEEIINGLHLMTLIEKATVVLRNKFHQYFPTDPTDLFNEITKHKQKLLKLVKKGIIYKRQYDILLPYAGKTDSSKFDISLLTLALRVLCPFNAPITGWETLPHPSDQSEGACLVRIRIDRNDLLHHDLEYDEKGYTNIWDRIALSLVGLGCDKQELIDLKSTSLDPTLQTDHERKLQDLKVALKRVADLEDSLEGVTYNLNLSVPSFVGREKELTEIHQKLTERCKNQLGMVIYGLGGVGKSELARQYCQRYVTTKYKRNVIWINAENKNTMTEDFLNVAERIKLKITDESDKQLSVKTVINKVYRFFADRPVLFVFDNVINKDDLMEFMEVNISSHLSVLITTQFTKWGERFMQMRTDVLSEEAAFTLVSQNLTEKHTLSGENIKLLCKKLQYLPLALQQAISYVGMWSETIEEYLEQFQSNADKVMTHIHGDEKYDKTVMTTWNMVLQKLKEERDSSLAITLINMMSYLDGKNIKKELFYEYYDQYSIKEAFDLLQRYSLITITTSDDDLQQTILMHSLLQYVIRKSTEHDFLQEFLDMIFSKVNDEAELENASYGVHWWYQLVYIFTNKECLNRLTANTCEMINKLFSIFKSKEKASSYHQLLVAVEKVQIASIGKKNNSTLTTQENIARCLRENRSYDEALVKHMEVERARINTLGCKHPSTLITQHSIAYCLQKLGNYDESLDKYIDVEKSEIDVLGWKHPITLATQNNIAHCLQQKGHFGEALHKYMEVEKLEIEVLGYKHPNTLTTQQNIAGCLEHLGNYDDALDKYLEVEKSQIDVLGRKHPNTLGTQHNIAHRLQQKGNYRKALDKFMEVEKLESEVLGYKHPSTLTTQQNIASCLQQKGHYDEALDKYVEVEKLQIEVLGHKHPSTLTTQHCIALCLQRKGNYAEALDKYVDVEKLEIEVFGNKHPTALATQNNIPYWLQQKGNYKEALDKYMEVEKSQIHDLGRKHPCTLETQELMASCLKEMGNYDDALDKYMEVEKLQIEVLGRKHPNTLGTEHNVAHLLQKEGNYGKALDKFMEVEMLEIEVLGCKHPSTLTTQQQIASCLEGKGNYDDALDKYLEVEKSQIDILGRKHPSTLATQNNIARLLQQKGNYDTALDKFMEVEKLEIEVLGCKHPSTLTIQQNIAGCLQQKENYDKAIDKYMDVEKLQIEVLGCKHQSTLTTQNNLAYCLQRKGHYDEALDKYMEVEKLQIEVLGRNHPRTLIIQRNLANCLQEKLIQRFK